MPWLACAAVALSAAPAQAAGKAQQAAPPTTATVRVYDFGFYDASKTKQDTTVTIAPGGTVTFDYPSSGDGANVHNVHFGDGATTPPAPGPQPSGCTQLTGPMLGAVPPLPTYTLPPPWSGVCTFNTPGAYKFYCEAHPFMQGEVLVEAAQNNPPTVSGSRTPSGDVPSGTPVTFNATGSDPDGDTITYSWDFGDGDTATGAAATHTYPPSAATYSAVVTADDGHGGTTTSTVPVKIVAGTPNQNPTVTASRTPTGTVTAGSSVNFSATGTDPDGDTLTYSWDFGDTGSSTDRTPTHTFLTPGTYSVKVTASDGKGGTGTDTLSVTVVAANQNPTVTASRTPTGNVTAGASVNFTATGSDPDGDTLTYSWDFGDTGNSTDRTPTHTFLTPGTYSVKLTASDGKGGTGTDTLSVTVVAATNRDPSVTAGRTPTGDVATGTAIGFTATGTDPDGDTLTYAWDFGDTGTATGATASHTYTAAGAYTAKVTVSDGKGGTASATLPITVTTGTGCPPGFRDDFNGTALDSSWSVVRPDATSGGVVVGGGTVAIPTGAGDIYQTANSATNIVLRTAPTGAWTYTAKVNHHGNERYQQGGIIVYGDDDNYVKLDRTATNASGSTNTEFFEFIQEVAGTPRNATQDHTSNLASTFPSDFYLRITWDGTNLTGAYSTDGSAWTNVGRTATPLPANAKLGIFALSNGATTVVSPKFDYVTIDGPPCGSNQNPVISSATADKTSGIAPIAVNFTAAATDPDSGDTLAYAWDYGDGATGTGATASHTYNAAGTYTAKVTVTDGKGGSATKTIAVNVLAPDTPGSAFRALVFSKTAAFRHDSIPAGTTAIKNLGTTANFQVDSTEDGTMFRDDILSHYKVVIFLSTTGDVLTDDQQAAFERFIRAGGGYVGIHSAADTEYKWAWYGQLVGAYFRNHPNGTPTADVLVEDTTDPSDAGLPATWQRTDEWYNYQSPVNPVENGGGDDYDPRNTSGIHVLLKADESTYAEDDGSDGVDDDHPISWCHRYDGGRSWYTGMGHTQASFQEAGFLSHILAGIRIAAGNLPSAACGVAAVNQNPTVTTSRTPSGNVTTGTSIAFTANGSDPDGDTLTYSWDFGDTGTSTQQNPSHTYAAAGTYAAKVTVSDGKGGTATSTLTVVVTQLDRNPSVTASRTPAGSVTTGSSVAFSAVGTDADGDALTYSWDFGDTGTATGATATHSYTSPGTYSAKVTVSDGKGGTDTDTLTVTVTQANRDPVVNASRTPAGNVDKGTEVSFAATATDADGDALTYAWDFGDSGTSTDQNPKHTYAAAGVYTAKVTASDGKGGTGSATLTVTVTGPPQQETQANSDVSATVGSVLELKLAPTADFGAIVPGITTDYTTSVTGTITSTRGDAVLTVFDGNANMPGHLVNGPYSLASAVQAQASGTNKPAGAFAPVGSSPVTLLSYSDPVSADAIGVTLKQPVSATELLRAGTYQKRLTFTLATTTP